jgi:hypothetical protein
MLVDVKIRLDHRNDAWIALLSTPEALSAVLDHALSSGHVVEVEARAIQRKNKRR